MFFVWWIGWFCFILFWFGVGFLLFFFFIWVVLVGFILACFGFFLCFSGVFVPFHCGFFFCGLLVFCLLGVFLWQLKLSNLVLKRVQALCLMLRCTAGHSLTHELRVHSWGTLIFPAGSSPHCYSISQEMARHPQQERTPLPPSWMCSFAFCLLQLVGAGLADTLQTYSAQWHLQNNFFKSAFFRFFVK